MDFSDKLKALREERSITQKQLANDLGVSRSSVAGYEVRDRLPDYDILKSISFYFNVSIDWLLGATEIRTRMIKPQQPYEEKYKKVFDAVRERLVNDKLINQHDDIKEQHLRLIIKHGIDSAIEIIKLKKEE